MIKIKFTFLIKKMIAVSLAGIQIGSPPMQTEELAPPPEALIQPWKEHITWTERDMLAQLVMAEAGNQDFTGKRLVVDTVINRVVSDDFPDTIEGVIYQKNQFSCIDSGLYDRCYDKVTKECYDAVIIEYTSLKMNDGILYFSSTDKPVNGTNAFKYQDHWFSY